MLKKWLYSVSSLLLAFTFFLPLLSNTIAFAEETNTIQKLNLEVTNSIKDEAITTKVNKDLLSNSLKDFATLSVTVYENEEPKVTSENLSSFVKTGVANNENGIKTALKPHEESYDAYVLTILYSQSNTPLAYHLDKLSIDNTPTDENKLQLSESDISIAPGETKEIKVTFLNEKGVKEDITLKPELTVENEDNDLITYKDGIITAGEEFGTTELTFNFLNSTASLNVTIEDKPELESIKIDPREFKLAVGKTLPLKVFGVYSDGSKEVLKEGLTWQTSNSAVATVKDGVVTGVKAGKSNVFITVSYEDFSAKTEGKIFVQEAAKIKNIIASPSKIKLKQGEKETIKIYAVYTDGKKKDVTKDIKWKISNTKIVTYSNGKIVAKAKGAAVIKASYQNFKTTITVVIEKKSKHDDDDRDHGNKHHHDDDNHKNDDHGHGKR